MSSEDKLAVWSMLIIVIMLALLLFKDYKVKKLETEQPKYIIELNNEMYELKRME